jgi:hypothetical protein
MKPDEKINNENPFRVPEGYFDSLADRTMAAIRESEVSNGTPGDDGKGLLPDDGQRQSRSGVQPAEVPSQRKPRIISMRPFLSLAAAILGFALLAAAVVRLVTADRSAGDYEPGRSLYADLAFEEVDAYTLENELFTTEPVTDEIPGEEISSETIIEYLMTEDIDLNDIYELL